MKFHQNKTNQLMMGEKTIEPEGHTRNEKDFLPNYRRFYYTTCCYMSMVSEPRHSRGEK